MSRPPNQPPTPPPPPRPTPPPSPSSALVADVESQLSAPLHTLVAGVLDDDVDTVTRAYLDEAAHLVSEALRVLARIETPARRDFPVELAPTGGPVLPAHDSVGEEPAPGSAVADLAAACESDGAVVAPVAGASFRPPQTRPFWIGGAPLIDRLEARWRS